MLKKMNRYIASGIAYNDKEYMIYEDKEGNFRFLKD